MWLNNLKREINKSGLKKNFIAEKLDMKYDTFRRKLNGENEFKVSEVFNLCSLLKIDIMEVFKNDKES